MVSLAYKLKGDANMKLCIVKPDGSIAEILMRDRPPSLETLNNEQLFFENYQYKIIVRDSENCDSVELFVGDYSIPVHYSFSTDCYETEPDLVFGGCFDLAYISVYIDDGEEKERIFYTDFLRIATTKQTTKQVEQMLDEIEKNLPNFLEVCFSRNKKNSGLMKNEVRSIWNTLKLVDEIIKIYEENYGYFSNHKKASVEPVATIVDVKSMRMIDQESLRWIACNPDNLALTEKESGIVVNQQNYMPSKVKTYMSQYSYDVYENKVVLGFLQNIIDYLESQIAGFSKEIIELENIPESIVVQLPNTHELTGKCVYIYYKGVMDRFSEKKNILQEIYCRYDRMLKCSAGAVYGIPKLTNTFKQVYHYRLCYECMVKWFESGDYTFDHLNYLFKLKTLSRIFEYFCLIKIQNAISLCGYVIQESNRIIYDVEDDSEDINNQYIFSGNGYEVTLLYEPSIWVDKVNTGINLYSTGYNFLKSRWNDRWTPDFVIKISGSYNEDYYYILDAKYSNARNVKKRYIPELVLKYSTQIASKDKFFSDIIGVGAIYPGEEDKMHFFKKNAVDSRKQSLPKYFSLAIVGENAGNVILKERLSELFKIVEALEQEKENAIILREEVNPIESVITDTVQQDVEVYATKHKKKAEYIISGKILDTEKDVRDINEKEHSAAVNVSGKKCFYYAKGMCLCQKKRCTIVDAPCDYYVSKNSKKLLKEDDSCRNLITYTRRGKVQRVECMISGLPGCIGSEECKFCLKKNKSKQ